jgi:hypothetical protein
MIEFVQRPGETVWVPGHWWHAVLNLDDTIAITQNVCTSAGFPRVWAEAVRNRRGMARKWIRILRRERPALAAAAEAYDAREGISLPEQARNHRRRKAEQAARRAARRVRRTAAATGTNGDGDAGDSSSDTSSGSSSSGSCTSSSSDSDTQTPRRGPLKLTPETAACATNTRNVESTSKDRLKPAGEVAGESVSHGVKEEDESEVEISFQAYSAQKRTRARAAARGMSTACEHGTGDVHIQKKCR